jgi:hypothetical protein
VKVGNSRNNYRKYHDNRRNGHNFSYFQAGNMPQIVRTLDQVAVHFKVTPRTITNWRRRGMPGHFGAYDLAEIRVWARTRKYQGASFRNSEEEALAGALFEIAVAELRKGLDHLARAYLRARGQGRQRLIDQALKQLVHGSVRQMDLLGDMAAGSGQGAEGGVPASLREK